MCCRVKVDSVIIFRWFSSENINPANVFWCFSWPGSQLLLLTGVVRHFFLLHSERVKQFVRSDLLSVCHVHLIVFICASRRKWSLTQCEIQGQITGNVLNNISCRGALSQKTSAISYYLDVISVHGKWSFFLFSLSNSCIVKKKKATWGVWENVLQWTADLFLSISDWLVVTGHKWVHGNDVDRQIEKAALYKCNRWNEMLHVAYDWRMSNILSAGQRGNENWPKECSYDPHLISPTNTVFRASVTFCPES